MLDIHVSKIRIDGGTVPSTDFEILLRFVCEFVVRVDGIEVFREVEFPFVEFASQVSAWLANGKVGDFDFESMDSAVHGLVYFHRLDGRWDVGSMVAGVPPPAAITDESLDEGLRAFLACVPAAVERFGVNVRSFCRAHLVDEDIVTIGARLPKR